MSGVLIMKARITKEMLKGKCIDVHTHAGGINFTNYYLKAFPYCNNINDLIFKMKKNGIDYSVCFPIPTNIDTYNSPSIDKDIRRIIELYEKHPYYFENERLLNESIIFGDNKVLPFIMISLYSKIDEQIDAYLELKEKYEIYGFKINASTDRKNINSILYNDKLKLFLEEEKKPIMIHSANDEYSSGISCLDLVRELKNVRFCIAHVARLEEKFFSEINNLENTWFDFSPIIKLYEMLRIQKHDFFQKHNINSIFEFVMYLCDNFPDKVLFGTDYPWSYCGYLDANIDKNLCNIYEENIKILKKVPINTCKKICTDNTLNYLFGR